jgi:aminoglycoside phosphotransferase (APT) family kinase protein
MRARFHESGDGARAGLLHLGTSVHDCATRARRAPVNIPELVNRVFLGPLLSDVMNDQRWLDLDANLIAGGKSNLTFEISSEAGTVILRRPPNGQLLPSAHDMPREARIQRALASTSIPVAKVLYLDASDDSLGFPFYVMERIEGHVIREALPSGYAESTDEKRALANTLIDVLVNIHRVDPAAIGLRDFGRADGYLERQIRRWGVQWAKTKTREVAAIDELSSQLKRSMPTSSRSSIVHGDYRLDNCVMSLESPSRMNAVLDWELSSLGDPMVDLALTLFYWREPGDDRLTLIPSPTASPGFPSRDHLANRYASVSGLQLEDLWFYEAFARYKFAVITQGVLARVANNAMAGQEFGNLDDEVRMIAEEGLDKLNRKGRTDGP